jgi:hypothetical protein
VKSSHPHLYGGDIGGVGEGADDPESGQIRLAISGPRGTRGQVRLAIGREWNAWRRMIEPLGGGGGGDTGE